MRSIKERHLLYPPGYKDFTEEDKLKYQIAKTVRNLRQLEFLTQQEFAQIADLQQSGVVRLEKGVTMPSLYVLIKIARALGRQIEIRFKL
jgi:DNA-binding XRE family transcriptional regulator